MMGTEEKTLFCFCHWGRNNKVLPDGSASYVGGITGQIVVKTGIKYNDFVNSFFDRLGIDPSDKILHFTVKFDRSQLIRLRDQEGVNTLLQFNDGFAHVYASNFEEPNSRTPSVGAKKVELNIDSDSEPDTAPDIIPADHCHDLEFSNFGKIKAENCFAVGQIWACYDMVDGMPRLYAHITKVFSPKFNVMFSWLEAHPEDLSGTAWVQADLPVGCGKFRHGSSQCTKDRLTFSHQMLCEKSKRGRLFSVYPKKGETWALFKDWDIRWSSDPNKYRKYKYEIVEILSDYIGNIGVQVAYLGKVTGFVSLFQRTRLSAVGTFFVKPKELYKFSHRIPSSRMTGAELEGVPVGSFELDPASLTINPDDIWCPREVKEDRRTANSEPVETVSSAISLGTKDKSRMSGNATTSQNSGDVNGIHATDGESANIRRSPGGVNISEKKQSLMSSRAANNSHSTDFGDSRVKKSGCSSLEEEPNSRRSSGGATKPALIVDSDAEADTIPDSNPPQPTSFAVQETFWTGCPFCKIKYQYYSTYVNRVLRCRKCSKPFIAFKLGSPIKRATMS